MNKLLPLVKLLALSIYAVCGIMLALFLIPNTGWKALTVETGSMRPAIAPGSLVIIHRVKPTDLAVRDVATYVNPANQSQTITHRIIAVKPGTPISFVFKGDANPGPDPEDIVAGRVVGKVVSHIPEAGRVFDWLRSPWGIVLMVIIPGLLVIGSELRNLGRLLYSPESEAPGGGARRADGGLRSAQRPGGRGVSAGGSARQPVRPSRGGGDALGVRVDQAARRSPSLLDDDVTAAVRPTVSETHFDSSPSPEQTAAVPAAHSEGPAQPTQPSARPSSPHTKRQTADASESVNFGQTVESAKPVQSIREFRSAHRVPSIQPAPPVNPGTYPRMTQSGPMINQTPANPQSLRHRVQAVTSKIHQSIPRVRSERHPAPQTRPVRSIDGMRRNG